MPAAKKKEEVEEAAIIVADEPRLGSISSAESLIAQAIEKGTPVETMERLLAMRRELKAEWAKEQYDRAMAAFQAECPTIQKTKEVRTKSGATAYRFAPIESIVEQVQPYLKKNGFSYSTNMELIEDKVRVHVKVTHEAGHSEVTDMTVPLGNKTEIMSQTQVVAAAQTFAKRYAFCNAFGILTGDEDTDAANTPGPNHAPHQRPSTTSDAPASDKQRQFARTLLVKKGIKDKESADQVVKHFTNVAAIDELTKDQASKLIEGLTTLTSTEIQAIGVFGEEAQVEAEPF